MKNAVRIDDERIKVHRRNMAHSSVKQTLNALLNAKTDRLCKTNRNERNETMPNHRAGSYDGKLETTAGDVNRPGFPGSILFCVMQT